jgi:hypothetical protein
VAQIGDYVIGMQSEIKIGAKRRLCHWNADEVFVFSLPSRPAIFLPTTVCTMARTKKRGAQKSLAMTPGMEQNKDAHVKEPEKVYMMFQTRGDHRRNKFVLYSKGRIVDGDTTAAKLRKFNREQLQDPDAYIVALFDFSGKAYHAPM